MSRNAIMNLKLASTALGALLGLMVPTIFGLIFVGITLLILPIDDTTMSTTMMRDGGRFVLMGSAMVCGGIMLLTFGGKGYASLMRTIHSFTDNAGILRKDFDKGFGPCFFLSMLVALYGLVSYVIIYSI